MENDEVLAALRSQLDCYEKLSKLTKTQHECVQNSRSEDLLVVLKQRQGLIEEMTRLQKIVLPAKQNWKAYLETLSPDQQTEANTLMAETRRLLEEIAAADRDDTLVLQQRKFNLGKGINQATVARKFNRTYAQAAYGSPKERLDIQR
jgi:hypothetical protein